MVEIVNKKQQLPHLYNIFFMMIFRSNEYERDKQAHQGSRTKTAKNLDSNSRGRRIRTKIKFVKKVAKNMTS